MGRVQLALTVSDLEAAIDFYGDLFGATPEKRRPGYANFAIADPPLKLVLIEGAEPGLNHLGVEVEAVDAVRAATERLSAKGLQTSTERGVCCYADQVKVWVTAPDRERWEVYTVLGDADEMQPSAEACCGEVASCC